MTRSRQEKPFRTDSLAAERCIVELQRGREIMLTQPSHSSAVTLVEMLTPQTFESINAAGASQLILTGNRAKAMGRALDNDTAVLNLPTGVSLHTVQALAGLHSLYAEKAALKQWQDVPCEAAMAGLQLARHAHALPALLHYPNALSPSSALSVSVDEARLYIPDTGALMPMSRTRIPLATAESAELAVFKESHGSAEHVAITVGKPDMSRPVAVRLHSSCFTGDILGSMRCDCGEQLNGAISRMAATGGGIVLYLSQEGRGIGLASKLRAYQLQDEGLDTIEANQYLGFGDDERHYQAATSMLQSLGINRIKLVTNNPRKIDALRAQGIDVVDRLPSHATVNEHNARYLETKRERAGHLSTQEVVA